MFTEYLLMILIIMIIIITTTTTIIIIIIIIIIVIIIIITIIIIAFKGAIREFYNLLTVRSSGPGAVVCKSRATHRALICRVTCHVVRFVCWLVACLLNVPETCECISWTDLHRQFYMLSH